MRIQDQGESDQVARLMRVIMAIYKISERGSIIRAIIREELKECIDAID